MVHSQSLLAALVAIAVTSFALAIPIQGAAGVFSTQENAASTPGVPRTNFIPPPAPINSVYRRSVIVGEEAEDIDIDSGEEPYWVCRISFFLVSDIEQIFSQAPRT